MVDISLDSLPRFVDDASLRLLGLALDHDAQLCPHKEPHSICK